MRPGVCAAVAAVWTPRGLPWGWETPDAPLLPATSSTVAGPFYPVIRPLEQDSDLTWAAGRGKRAQGQVLHVAGRVLSRRGEPAGGAPVELWQANTFGRYDHPSDPNPAPLDPGSQGFAVQVTDRDGRFRFTTIKPEPHPADAGGGMRTPHIRFDVTGKTDRRLTQLFLAGGPLNAQDRILRQVPRNRERPIAGLLPAPTGEDPVSRLVAWDVILPRG